MMTSQQIAAIVLLTGVGSAAAQYDPFNGEWGKEDERDVRVMTWNVLDGINSKEVKAEDLNQWTALAVIVAGMRPDVLILQETGDKAGGVDTVGQLETTIDLFLHGGADPFNGGEVGAYVQKYAPGYDLGHVFVSGESDGFNRNVILSRYPFKDLNGDGKATLPDIPFVFPDEYAIGGDGGIRGFMFAEIDLPDGDYPGDVVIGNAHLKAGFGGDDHDDRIRAATNVAYYIDYLFNGAGTGQPDPNEAIFDSPPATTILGDETPVIFGGDWNEDEITNGTKGPAEWLKAAASIGGTDGTDRDRSDSTLDGAVNPFNGDDDTLGNSKLDYICVQDSIAEIRHAWVFASGDTPGDLLPPEVKMFPGFAGLASGFASDHFPIVIDAIVPVNDKVTPPGAFALVSPAEGAAHVSVTPTMSWETSVGAETYDVIIATDELLEGVVLAIDRVAETMIDVPADVLEACTSYYWGVTAINGAGDTVSSPYPGAFSTIVKADVNGDGVLNILDFVAFQNQFQGGNEAADVNGDGVLNILDFVAFQGLFVGGGC
jgi:endonuclease/exonuclease/phosphatase family metal-dependent hydrolase